jgi:hypothetical protein
MTVSERFVQSNRMSETPRPRTLAHPRTRFALPDELAAAEPPEARGLARDEVRLLAASSCNPAICWWSTLPPPDLQRWTAGTPTTARWSSISPP